MRADATRNLNAVLRTGARLLAEDPSTSIAAIASAAGVDRATVHRRFTTREALLSAVFQAKLDSAEEVLDQARLTEAPVAVALHRYVEAIIPVSREWPLNTRRMMRQDPAADARREEQSGGWTPSSSARPTRGFCAPGSHRPGPGPSSTNSLTAPPTGSPTSRHPRPPTWWWTRSSGASERPDAGSGGCSVIDGPRPVYGVASRSEAARLFCGATRAAAPAFRPW
jgi:AcrR family transcriptional regulator